MATKKKKSEVIQDDKVHVDFVGEPALFIRKVAFKTGRSNSETGNLLIGLLMKMEETTTVELKPDAQIPGKEAQKPVRFKKITQLKVEI